MGFFLFFFTILGRENSQGVENLKIGISPVKIQKTFDKIIESSNINKEHLGLYVGSPYSSTPPLYLLNSEKKMIPASITKLITAAVTLVYFPPGTKLKTQILSPARIQEGVLKGSLYLKGGGDPSFVSETMWFLVNSFTRNKIKKIEGDILVDDSLFDKLRYDPSRQKERVDRAYDAPTGAMSFNWNSVNVFIRPANKAGDLADVFVDPQNEYIQIKGSVKTVSNLKGSGVHLEREEHKESLNNRRGDLLMIGGKIGMPQKEQVIFKNITKPDLWSGYNLKAFLKERGIEVSGKVLTGVTPKEARLLAEAESKPMEEILKDMNKFSNNYVAEMLTKLLASSAAASAAGESGISSSSAAAAAAAKDMIEDSSSSSFSNPLNSEEDLGPDASEKSISSANNSSSEVNTSSVNSTHPTNSITSTSSEESALSSDLKNTKTSLGKGSIEKGMQIIRNYLNKLGVKKEEYELFNPSGLTRTNLVKASTIGKVLEDMKKQSQFYPEYVASLPIAGIDGTLKKRFRESSAERWVRAKTGFLTGVVSLSGYIGLRDGTVLPFVFMYNGSKDENSVRSLFDRLVLIITDYKE